MDQDYIKKIIARSLKDNKVKAEKILEKHLADKSSANIIDGTAAIGITAPAEDGHVHSFYLTVVDNKIAYGWTEATNDTMDPEHSHFIFFNLEQSETGESGEYNGVTQSTFWSKNGNHEHQVTIIPLDSTLDMDSMDDMRD
jgi:hypothetical protein